MDRLKGFIKPLGYVITCLSLLYIANILLHFDLAALRFSNPVRSVFFIVVFGLWAGVFVVIGAYNWKLILEFLHGKPLPARDVFSVYLKSNVAKYLPGNVMHYAGRNFLGSRLGWNNSEIAFSSLLEFAFGLGLTGIVVLLFLGAGLVTLPAQFPLTLNYQGTAWYAAVAAVLAILLLFLVYAYRLFVCRESVAETSQKLRRRGEQFLTGRFLVLLVKLFAIALVCFVLNCAFYFYLCELVLDFHLRPADFFTANAALTLATYLGTVTPGMPGGMGVRESVSVLLLAGYGYPKEVLLVSLLVFRIACVLGDLFPYLAVISLPPLPLGEGGGEGTDHAEIAPPSPQPSPKGRGRRSNGGESKD